MFLDLEQNRYSCLPVQHTPAAVALLGLTDADGAVPAVALPHAPDGHVTRLARLLVKERLLAESGSSAQRRRTREPERPDSQMVLTPAGLPASLRYSMAFYRSVLNASLKLRYLSLRNAVRTVVDRKRSACRSGVHAHGERAELVAAFSLLRPFYFRQYRCLFDSLALIEFLARFGHFPSWVFGVKTDPFGAHCWVQDGKHVLNDDFERVRIFTPIMAV